MISLGIYAVERFVDPGEVHFHYTFDDLYQLQDEEGVVKHAYLRDSLYNCLNKDGIPLKVNVLNQMIHSDRAAFTYDLCGNIVKAVYSDKTLTYRYDALDRLIYYSDGQCDMHYSYDAFNRRISKAPSNGVSIDFLYLGDHEIGSCDKAGRHPRIEDFRGWQRGRNRSGYRNRELLEKYTRLSMIPAAIFQSLLKL